MKLRNQSCQLILGHYKHFKAVQEVGWQKNPRSGHEYKIFEATTRSGKIIKYAVDEMGRVFYDLNNLP